jgi:hypothetical protein
LERTLEGNDWDNMLTLHPEPLFDPADPRVSASLRKIRAEYAEGVLDFVLPRAVARLEWPGQAAQAGAKAPRAEGYIFEAKPSLHYWQCPDNAMNALVRGRAEDQENAVRDLYSLLVHTTSTHAPQEFGTYPWSTRDFEGANSTDILPDGSASGKTIELLRNMLVREYKTDLYLLSAVSPEWLKAGNRLRVVDEATEFGPISFSLEAASGSWELNISARFWTAPERLVIRIPWFYRADRIEVDGRQVRSADAQIVVPATARRIRVNGSNDPGMPALSYETAVANYKREYRRRFEEFLRTGEIRP